MKIKLHDAELKIMDVVWKNGEITAKKIADYLIEKVGWRRTTIYTLINRCVSKAALEKCEPNFTCKALVTREEVQQNEVEELLDKLFDGSKDHLLASLVKANEKLSAQDIERLLNIIEKVE